MYDHVCIYLLQVYISLEISSNYQYMCMYACMYVCIYVWKITNKQGIEWNMYTTWDASLQDLCGRIPWELNT